MTGKPDKTQSGALLLYQLKRLEQIRLEQGDHGLTPAMRLLKRWQSERLARTHAELLAKPRYRLAGDYFLSEIYGDKDFSRRDHDLERAYPIIVRTMPTGVLHTVAMAVELNALTWELDTELLQVLLEEFGLTESLDEETYAGAYRYCNNYDRRLHQIGLIQMLGQDLSKAVRNPFIYGTLLLAKAPAYLAGFGNLHEFIESGFRAFRHLGDPNEFLTSIANRERHILDRIYAAHPQPFALAD